MMKQRTARVANMLRTAEESGEVLMLCSLWNGRHSSGRRAAISLQE